MEKIIKKLHLFAVIVIVAVISFIIFNFIIFTGVVTSSKTMPFATARAYMLSAKKINELYIYPLTNLSGWESPATKPFYILRNKLYKIGLSKFPENEGETEIWWYKIKQDEFRLLVYDRLVEYSLNKYPAKYLFSKKDEFIRWNNELYKHIESMAKAKITDKNFKKQKLAIFVDLAMVSQEVNDSLILALNTQKQGKFNPNNSRAGIYPTIDQVQKYDKVYNFYINLLDYSKKYEKDTYHYFIENNKMWGFELAHNIARSMLQAKFYSNQLDCNDKYLKIYSDVHKEIIDYYFANEKNTNIPLGLKIRLNMSAMSTFGLMVPISYKCRNNPDFQDYIQYIVKKEPDKKNQNIVIIKDLYLRDLKTLKQYDVLKRVNTALKEK